jgi:hypothetical protein
MNNPGAAFLRMFDKYSPDLGVFVWGAGKEWYWNVLVILFWTAAITGLAFLIGRVIVAAGKGHDPGHRKSRDTGHESPKKNK